MSSKWRKVDRGSTLGKGKGQGKLRRLFQGRLVLIIGISAGLIRDFLTKGSQFHRRFAMIGIPSPNLGETMKYINLRRGHLAGIVEN